MSYIMTNTNVLVPLRFDIGQNVHLRVIPRLVSDLGLRMDTVRCGVRLGVQH